MIKYMAASVPRSIRQSRLSYLPITCVIGNHFTKGDSGDNLVYDVIMLPVQHFQRMRANIGLEHVHSPVPTLGAAFTPAFIPTDTREVTVPEGEADPINFAKNYFLAAFNLITPPVPVAGGKPGFADLARTHTVRKSDD